MADAERETGSKQPDNRQANGAHKLTCAGPGRPKGVPNRINAEFKAGIIQSYKNRGGVKFLDSLDPALFTSLMRSVIPKEIAQDVNITTKLETSVGIHPPAEAKKDNSDRNDESKTGQA